MAWDGVGWDGVGWDGAGWYSIYSIVTSRKAAKTQSWLAGRAMEKGGTKRIECERRVIWHGMVQDGIVEHDDMV